MNRSSTLPITRSPDQTVRRKILSWYRREKRRLPWRGTSDPYRIWVSEIMLQQTTVTAVRGRFEEFLRLFPDLASLARAREDAVLAAWSGLGYYARARNLLRAARVVRWKFGGKLPPDPEMLESLPGFGPYTAAAVASLAFGARIPAADANVTRVLSRLFALRGASGSRAHTEKVLARAGQLLPSRRAGDFTAALMDLGQTICVPRRPVCPGCPLRAECTAFRRGEPERYPVRRRRPRPVTVHLAAAFAENGGRALLVRRRASFLDGLWEFPSAEAKTAEGARRRLACAIRPLGLRLRSSSPSGVARHTVVNRRLSISVFSAVARPRFSILDSRAPSSRWFRAADLERAAIPTLTRKIARAAGFPRE
jgi:A/G-specific adenine glycosylase